jgi:hypothetical protein
MWNVPAKPPIRALPAGKPRSIEKNESFLENQVDSRKPRSFRKMLITPDLAFMISSKS